MDNKTAPVASMTAGRDNQNKLPVVSQQSTGAASFRKGKRKFCVVTRDFSGLGFGLLNKTDDVIFATNPDLTKFKDKPEELEKYKKIGDGLVTKFALKDVMSRRSRMRDWYFIFDGNHSVNENEQLRREGFKVGLGGALSYKMENDREFGIMTAEKFGIESPLWEEFKTAEEGVKFLESHPDQAFVFKPNAADESYLTTVPYTNDPQEANENMRDFIKAIDVKGGFILQEKVKGIEVNVEYFCVKGEVKSAQLNLEAKRISSDDTGTMCGCAFDVCRDLPLDSKLVQLTVAKIIPFIRESKYTGFADLNCIIGENEIWFIEWCWRTGYNAHPNYFMNLAEKDYLNTVADMVDGTYKAGAKRGWGASVTMYVDHPHEGIPMNIPEKLKDKVYLFDGMKKNGLIVETGASNELLIVGEHGFTIKTAMENALEHAEKLRTITGVDFRKDGAREGFSSSPRERYAAIMELGYV